MSSGYCEDPNYRYKPRNSDDLEGLSDEEDREDESDDDGDDNGMMTDAAAN